MKVPVFLVSLLAFATIISAADPKIETLSLGATAPDFKLPGVDGRDWALSDFQDAKVLVVVFTCVHCPTAQAYEERLKKIVSDYKGKGVAVVAISPNDPKSVRLDELGYTDLADSFEDMKLRAKDKAFNFPFLYDGENEAVSRAYGPTATPHAFVFDAARKLRYVGRIDDAERESLLKVSDLRNAIDALLNGGTSFRIQLVAEPDEKGERKEITKTMVDQTVEVIRKRVDKLGTSEPIIAPAGTDGILVQIPGLSAEKLESARWQLRQVARLEFRIVHPNGEQIVAGLAAPDPDYKVETYKDERNGKPFEEQLLVKKKADIPGSMVTAAHAIFDIQGLGGQPAVQQRGRKAFWRFDCGQRREAHRNYARWGRAIRPCDSRCDLRR
jgi:peroxiredoxin